MEKGKKKIFNFFFKFYKKKGMAAPMAPWGPRGGKIRGRGGPPRDFDLGTSLEPHPFVEHPSAAICGRLVP